MNAKTCFVIGLLSALTGSVRAAERVFTVATSPDMINHWPSADAFIGTADDAVSPAQSSRAKSSPNTAGSRSFIVTRLGFGGPPDPFLYGTWDTITFVQGLTAIDPDAFIAPTVPMIRRLEFSGTDLFPGHGAYSVRLTNPRNGTYTRTGNAIQFNSGYDFEGTFAAGQARAENATASGWAALVESANFASPSLAALPADLAGYVQSVAIPLAQSRSASAVLCARMDLNTAGSVPGTSGYFPPLTAQGIVLALEFAPPPDFRITKAERTPQGLLLEWTPLTGKTYTVESSGSLAAAFTPLTTGLAVATYLDTSPVEGQLFYRIRAQ